MSEQIKIRRLYDGIYTFSPETKSFFSNRAGIDSFETRESDENDNWKIDLEMMEEFIRENCPEFLGKDIWIGDAYEVYGFFILDQAPLEIKAKESGSGFNYGSCNLLTVEFPCKILILAQND